MARMSRVVMAVARASLWYYYSASFPCSPILPLCLVDVPVGAPPHLAALELKEVLHLFPELRRPPLELVVHGDGEAGQVLSAEEVQALVRTRTSSS